MKFSNEMIEKAKTAKSAEELLAMAKAENIEISAEEAAKAFAELNKTGELSDDELDNVAGGCGDSNKSGDTPKYSVGQRGCCRVGIPYQVAVAKRCHRDKHNLPGGRAMTFRTYTKKGVFFHAVYIAILTVSGILAVYSAVFGALHISCKEDNLNRRKVAEMFGMTYGQLRYLHDKAIKRLGELLHKK